MEAQCAFCELELYFVQFLDKYMGAKGTGYAVCSMAAAVSTVTLLHYI